MKKENNYIIPSLKQYFEWFNIKVIKLKKERVGCSDYECLCDECGGCLNNRPVAKLLDNYVNLQFMYKSNKRNCKFLKNHRIL